MHVVELTRAPAPDAACTALLELPGVALLESVGHFGDLGRWSFLSADPFLRLRARGRTLTRTGVPGRSVVREGSAALRARRRIPARGLTSAGDPHSAVAPR